METIKSTGAASPGGAAQAPRERIILGIDPGTTVMGFGVLQEEGGKVRLLEAGAIRFDPDHDHTLKMKAHSEIHKT